MKLAALTQEAAALRQKMADGSLTDDDRARITAIADEAEQLRKSIKDDEDLAARLDSAAGPVVTRTADQDQPTGSIGERFVKSAALRAFRDDHQAGVPSETPISIKAKNIGGYLQRAPLNTDDTGNAAPVRTGEVDDLTYRPRPTILDLITRGNTNLPYVQYRQIISKTNNASIVAEAKTSTGTDAAGGLKPLSSLTTKTAEAREHTYADGMEVTNQELSDDGIIQALIDSTLRENLDLYTGHLLINGAGTAAEPAGILNTTGVLQQDFNSDLPTTVRKAITRLRTTSGGIINGVVLNPEDDEAWDLLQDADGRYLGNGPFSQGPNSAWGYTRISDPTMPIGTAVMGDFKQIHLLMYEALSVLAFNQHKDYAQRNLVYIRAEFRALQMIRNAARLCVIDVSEPVTP